MNSVKEKLKELSAAEDFLEYFSIPYDENIVKVNRLHILKRMKDYLDEVDTNIDNEDVLHDLYREKLGKAYADFTGSSAIEERVFKVHKDYDPNNKNAQKGCSC